MPTNKELNDKREEFCIAVTPERKYYKVGDTWIKRSLRPTEWQKHDGYTHVPLFNLERVLNEGACLQFLAANTTIPIPKLYACFEDDGAAYIITEYVQGVSMVELEPDKQEVVAKELETHLQTLAQLKSDTWGFKGMVGRPNASKFAEEQAKQRSACKGSHARTRY